MCLSPIRIKNPARSGYVSVIGKVSNDFLCDNSSQYIEVPCGHCSECIASQQMFFCQRVQMEALNNYLFFATFTYANDMIPVLDVNGYRHQYADIHDFQTMLKRVRFKCANESWYRPFHYVYCTEYGSNTHRPHFHAIFSVPKYPNDTDSTPFVLESHFRREFLANWSRNIGSDKKPLYKPLCHYFCRNGKRNYDFHFIEKRLKDDGTISTEQDVAYYVSKYICKFDDWLLCKQRALKLNLSPSAYADIWKFVKTRRCLSKGFGYKNYLDKDGAPHPNVVAFIRNGISISKTTRNSDGYNNTCPCFLTHEGKLCPLSPYYQKRVLTLYDRLDFFYRNNNPEQCSFCFNFCPSRIRTRQDITSASTKFSRIKAIIKSRNGDNGSEFELLSEQKEIDAVSVLYVDLDSSHLCHGGSPLDDSVFDDIPDFISPPDNPLLDNLCSSRHGVDTSLGSIGFERFWLRRKCARYPFGISSFRPILGTPTEFQKKIEKIS